MRLFAFLCSLIPASSFGNANFGCHVHSLHLWLCLRDDRALPYLLGGGNGDRGIFEPATNSAVRLIVPPEKVISRTEYLKPGLSSGI